MNRTPAIVGALATAAVVGAVVLLAGDAQADRTLPARTVSSSLSKVTHEHSMILPDGGFRTVCCGVVKYADGGSVPDLPEGECDAVERSALVGASGSLTVCVNGWAGNRGL